MYNFEYYVPTRIHFGSGEIDRLSELKESGSKVLLCYGGGSIKKTGLYDRAMDILKISGLSVFELSGIEPNPRIETVRKGAEICKKEGIDMVLAIGGGSTIDCAKIVAAAALYSGDPWDFMTFSVPIEKALPVYSVLTLSATGSEMDPFAVISDPEKNDKIAVAAEALLPRMSVLDPEYTFTVSKKQTAAGTADIMSHTFENYFHNTEGCEIQEQFAESILRVCIKYGPIALSEPDNYEARANLMWAGSHAINGLIAQGCADAWCVHPIEHELSAFFDMTHGEGLALLTPTWMEKILSDKTAPVFARYGRNVWGLDGDDMDVAKKAIDCTREFFTKTMGMPASLKEAGIDAQDKLEIMAEKAAAGIEGCFVPLSKEDIIDIYTAIL